MGGKKVVFENQIIFEEDGFVWVFENGKAKMYRRDEIEVKEPNWDRIKEKWAELIRVMHEELGFFNEEELRETPRRATGVLQEWYGYQTYKKWKVFDNGGPEGTYLRYDQLVVLKDIRVFSKCSHHYETIDMKVHIAYLPGEKVIGLSKLARAARKFASKPQIQEQYTQELINFLWEVLKPKFVMVWVEGVHYCVVSRGARAEDAKMATSAIKYDPSLTGNVVGGLKEEAMRMFGV